MREEVKKIMVIEVHLASVVKREGGRSPVGRC